MMTVPMMNLPGDPVNEQTEENTTQPGRMG